MLLDLWGLLLSLFRIWTPTPRLSSWFLPQYLTATPFSLLLASPFFCPSWVFLPSKELGLYVFSVSVFVSLPHHPGQVAGLSGLEEMTASPCHLSSSAISCSLMSVLECSGGSTSYCFIFFKLLYPLIFHLVICSLSTTLDKIIVCSYVIFSKISKASWDLPLNLVSLPLLLPSYTS